MTPLQQKINVVVQYIYDMTGKDIKNITFKNGDNSRELEMLDKAFDVAIKYYNDLNKR